MDHFISLPLKNTDIKQLKAGDIVYLSGYIYTARDAAHKKLVEDFANNKAPIDIVDRTIYYVGPCPAPKNHLIGSSGPTTSARMDNYTSQLLENGLKGMIGKGPRADYINKAIKEFEAIYFIACGGAGALLAKCITKVEEIAYQELGTESIKRLEIKNFPVIVATDSKGDSVFGVKKINR
ncbi:MAG: FumA C-terminus/TtdB family hydratase beta subunit [Clostridia bacterium]